MKQIFIYIFSIFIFYNIIDFYGKVNMASVEIGKSVVPNQCSSLGTNNPLRLLDCSIFQLSKGMCCLLTITKTKKDIDDDGVESLVEYFETACIVLEKIDAQIINKTTIEYKNLGGDVLIECSQEYFNKSFLIILIIFTIIILI